MNQTWLRVNRKRPCKICRRPDWCGYSADGTVACCMRIQSDKEVKNGGWIHRLRGEPIPYIAPSIRAAIQDPPLDADGMWREWDRETEREHLDGFAMTLGVDTDALRSIGCAWSGKAWAFPMRDAYGQTIGIRLRDTVGHKWAVKGSRQGLFIPTNDNAAITETGTLWLTEGPTDLAAALTIGLAAVGRPACIGQEEMILKYIETWRARRLVIAADADEPGMKGAAKLQALLPVPSVVVNFPCKDIREFVNYGGDFLTAQSMIRDLVWEQPRA